MSTETATLNTIARDVKAVKIQVEGVIDTQKVQGNDIVVLKDWKRSQEVAKEAVAEYKRQEQSDKLQRSRNTAYNGVKDLMPYIIAVLAAVAALIYAKISSGSTH
jgi:hypothetical protein